LHLALLPFASLFVSCFIMMTGNGLINVLMPVRMDMDGLDTSTIGMVLSLYFVGMLIGGRYSVFFIKRAGHIRVFAGSLALAAISILVCSLYSSPILWGLMRIVIGFCNATAFTAMESWLSDSATKDTRGKILSFYQAVVLAAMFSGQFLINIASPLGTELFVMAGILLVASIIPMAISRKVGPIMNEVAPMSLLTLFRLSPLGVVTCFVSGIIYSASFNLLPVFANRYNITGFDLSIYMGSAILGAFLLQFPVGWLSDKFDRRSVLLFVLAISAVVGFSINFMASQLWFWPMSLATAITCGIIATTYPLSISESFDKLRKNEMVAAMGSLLIAFAAGGIIGPYMTSLVMVTFGNHYLFWFLGFVQLGLGLFVLYRMKASQALPVQLQEQFVMQSAVMATGAEMDPRTEYIEPQHPLSPEAEIASKVADSNPAAAVNIAKAVALSTSEDQGAEVAGAVASVEGVDVLRLYRVMQQTVPEQIKSITTAIVAAQPKLAYDIVSQLAISMPNEVVDIAAHIGSNFPELRLEMARIAVENAPETAVQVAEYYAHILAEEHTDVRPADRVNDTSEQDAADLATGVGHMVPDQALEVAVAVVEVIPDAAVSVVSDYADYLSEQHTDAFVEEMINTVDHINTPEDADEEFNREAVELVSRMAEAAPEQTMDIAGAVVEALPEYASDIIDAISEHDESKEHEFVVNRADWPKA